jgi:hypothetical protein
MAAGPVFSHLGEKLWLVALLFHQELGKADQGFKD